MFGRLWEVTSVRIPLVIMGCIWQFQASTIYVSYYDEAYDMLVDWIADQPFVHGSHSLIARVRSTQRASNLHSTKKKPLTSSPWDGSFSFWYKGHLLILHCDVKEHREDLRISSIGLNANILKSLIEECREKYLKDTQRKTSVFENREGECKKARLRPVDLSPQLSWTTS